MSSEAAPAIRVHDTLTGRKEAFVPRDPGRVSMYVCGPTVYNDIHIGNARTFLSFDVIRRYLVWRGFDVHFVRNITDVDDKIIRQAAEEGISAAEVAEKYTAAFLQAMDDLGTLPPDDQPRATETIPGMIEMIRTLIDRGHAYVLEGDVYFAVRSFPGYGKLSGRDIDELESGARVEVDVRKRDPLDFALWKTAKPGEPKWPSPWGEGRPGWHIECSVMSLQHLGPAFDIHGGGSDLIFPHHENELAQAEAATGQPFARHWIHGGMLQINAEKMSKSLGNFTTLKAVLESHPAAVVRLLMLQTHYRSPLDFSDERLHEARTALERIANAVRNVRWVQSEATAEDVPGEQTGALRTAIAGARAKFTAEMDDDFNSAGAVGAIFELVKTVNGVLEAREGCGCTSAELSALGEAADAIVELLGVLGIDLPEEMGESLPDEVVPLADEFAGYGGDDPAEAAEALLAARATARGAKEWAIADGIRDALGDLGLAVEDTVQGSRIVRRSEG